MDLYDRTQGGRHMEVDLFKLAHMCVAVQTAFCTCVLGVSKRLMESMCLC